MQTPTILLCIGALICALAIAVFQYGYASSLERRKKIILIPLRFLSIFTLLVLLINPKYKTATFSEKKPTLVVAVDHSKSIQHINQVAAVQDAVVTLKAHEKLNANFDIEYYAFSNTIEDTLDFNFSKPQTNIEKTLTQLQQMYRDKVTPLVLISDGNQTYGSDYQFSAGHHKPPIYPMVVGDTTVVVDTKIKQLNVNTYAYVNNKFPVEVMLAYSGTEAVSTQFTITSDTQTVYSTPIHFSEVKNAHVLTITLPAKKQGLQRYTAVLSPVSSEKNRVNNTKQFAIEVIDQKTNVAIVSSSIHPDLGMLKRSIESNKRSSVTIVKPSEITSLSPYQFLILYNPDSQFKALYDRIKNERKNTFTITGTHTDWNFLNTVQQSFKGRVRGQFEYYTPTYNGNFGTFLTEDIGFEAYPPLHDFFGEVTLLKSSDVVLYRTIEGVTTEVPLFATIESKNRREAVLFGSDLWKWRAHTYKENKSFERFDNFLGKITQYLSNTTERSRLRVFAEPFYYGNSTIIVRAEYVTKNYEFDRRASLTLNVTHKEQKTAQSFPMLLKNNGYAVDLSSLSPGDYVYNVKVAGEEISARGSFSILAFDVEQQFTNADIKRLTYIAQQSKGSLFFIDQTAALISDLLQDKRYKTIQISEEKVIALIDWKYLLGLLILLLSIEWFVRKYNGLI